MAIEVFGTDQTVIESYYPQLLISASSKLTPARMAEIVEGAAAAVGAIIESAFGHGTVSAIATDTTSLEYRNCQQHVIVVAGPELLAATHGHTAVEGYTDLADLKNEALDRLQRNPAAAIGRVQDATMYPGVSSSTQYRNLKTTTAALRAGRTFDGRSRRAGVDSGGFIH